MYIYIYCRGAWRKALSDFSFQISLYSVVNNEENLTLHQKSLKALFHTPLLLMYMLWRKKKQINYKFIPTSLFCGHPLISPDE